jgi:hypothetical protein
LRHAALLRLSIPKLRIGGWSADLDLLIYRYIS